MLYQLYQIVIVEYMWKYNVLYIFLPVLISMHILPMLLLFYVRYFSSNLHFGFKFYNCLIVSSYHVPTCTKKKKKEMVEYQMYYFKHEIFTFKYRISDNILFKLTHPCLFSVYFKPFWIRFACIFPVSWFRYVYLTCSNA